MAKMSLLTQAVTLAGYAIILHTWAWVVLLFVFPLCLAAGALVAAGIATKILNFPSIPLRAEGKAQNDSQSGSGELPWWQVSLTNVNLRTPLVVAFVLPASLVFDVFFALRTRFVRSAGGTHEDKVANVQRQVRRWADQPEGEGGRRAMCTARGGWLTISPKQSTYKRGSHQVAVEMYDVLEIDADAMTVRVEPGVSMGQLSAHLLDRGYMVPVLPEMDDLTVGGLINGCGVEVSSHVHGMFQHICVAFELCLADGSVVEATAESDPDLFHAVPWSYGSIGFLLSAKLRLQKAKPYVRLEYTPCDSESEFVSLFTELCKRGDKAPEFIEGLIYAKDDSVIMTGTTVDAAQVETAMPSSSGLAPPVVNDMAKWWKPWFAWHAHDVAERARDAAPGRGRSVEFVPIRAFLHRHTRSIFWELQDMLPAAIGNNPIFRHTLGWLVPPKVAFLKLIQPEAMRLWYEKQHVIQDMLVPISTLKDSLAIFREQYDLYPLWVCPMRIFDRPGMIRPAPDGEQMFVDLGAYGIPRAAWEGTFDAPSAGLAVEEFVRRKGGYQMLYADYMSEAEFESMFHTELLNKVRQKYGAVGAFRTPYEKTIGRSANKHAMEASKKKA